MGKCPKIFRELLFSVTHLAYHLPPFYKTYFFNPPKYMAFYERFVGEVPLASVS